MCTMLIIVPLVTETTDTLIGCGLLILGFIPYKLWRNRSYVPKPIIALADCVQRTVGKKILVNPRKSRKILGYPKKS